jgi:RNA methyltransferase, TrmH family
MLESITSAVNPIVKDVRRAVARGSLTRQGWCVAETPHLLEEALRSGSNIKMILAAESARGVVEPHASAIRTALLPDALLQSISGTETAQGVIALIDPPQWGIAPLFAGNALVVVLDGLQDPGNAGTIVRTAEAFGATGAIFVKGTASPYNPKTIRASAGSLFRLPVLHGMDASCARTVLQDGGGRLFAALPAGADVRPPDAADFTASCAIIIGNEACGVSAAFRSVAEGISIPTIAVESLNAAVAAGILLYEARRQRTFRL